MTDIEKIIDASSIPTICSKNYQQTGNLYVRLEGKSYLGNIKIRSAYYMVKSIYEKFTKSPPNIVESSSGNLAIGLNFFASKFNTRFLCLIDETLPSRKKENLIKHGVKFRIVKKYKYPDFRTARIAMAKKIGNLNGYIWTNQYANKANMNAHFETTAPAIFKSLNKNKINWILCSVGSGGTICGISKYMKQISDCDIRVVGIEPAWIYIFWRCIC